MENSYKDPAYWQKRKKDGIKFIKEARKRGRPKNLDSPEELWDLACEYFQRQDGSPWNRTDYRGKDAEAVSIPTAAPYLWSGFEDFLYEKKGITTLKDYRTASRNPDYRDGAYANFAEVVTRVDSIMVSQKISGALVGAYNSNLVARLEGLADKTEEVGVTKTERPKFVFINKTETKIKK
jgi:hypothetical protein